MSTEAPEFQVPEVPQELEEIRKNLRQKRTAVEELKLLKEGEFKVVRDENKVGPVPTKQRKVKVMLGGITLIEIETVGGHIGRRTYKHGQLMPNKYILGEIDIPSSEGIYSFEEIFGAALEGLREEIKELREKREDFDF